LVVEVVATRAVVTPESPPSTVPENGAVELLPDPRRSVAVDSAPARTLGVVAVTVHVTAGVEEAIAAPPLPV